MPESARPAPEPPDSQARLRWLLSPAAHAVGSGPVHLIETHMSWVVLDDVQVLKLKKPVRLPPLIDFSTAPRRRLDARDELALNRRLAPDVYLGVLALQWHAGTLALMPEESLPAPGQTIDWLVRMRRLPEGRMLDRMLAGRTLRASDVDALAEVLVPFYRSARVSDIDVDGHLARFEREHRIDREMLLRAAFDLTEAPAALERLAAALQHHAGLLAGRVRNRRIVDGHGDLRPEHVCLLVPPVVIDCLEFSAALRQVDPFEETAFLGLECEMAGAGWVGPQLNARCMAALGDHAEPPLLALYTACRALLRARLAVAHLLDARPRTPERWLPLARRYLGRALQALDEINGSADLRGRLKTRP